MAHSPKGGAAKLRGYGDPAAGSLRQSSRIGIGVADGPYVGRRAHLHRRLQHRV